MIKGIQKFTLIDYPGKIACTIFIGGCNFRCGYCYNSDLVFNANKMPTIPENEILNFLKERKNYLEGVCITGGEPTLWKGLLPFISDIKKISYTVKLDTNGTLPDVLRKIIDQNLVDYLAMDIKASLPSYAKVIGIETNLKKIRESIELIKNSGIAHEFRTTMVPDIMNMDEIEEIAKMVDKSSPYYIQQFRPDEKTIDKRYSDMPALAPGVLENFKEIARKTNPAVELRNM